MSTPRNVTATGTVHSGEGFYSGFSIGSTAGAVVVIYDGVTAAGTVLASFTLAAAGFLHVDLAKPARVGTGIHLTSTATLQGHVRVA